jgi:hypothetical protein
MGLRTACSAGLSYLCLPKTVTMRRPQPPPLTTKGHSAWHSDHLPATTGRGLPRAAAHTADDGRRLMPGHGVSRYEATTLWSCFCGLEAPGWRSPWPRIPCRACTRRAGRLTPALWRRGSPAAANLNPLPAVLLPARLRRRGVGAALRGRGVVGAARVVQARARAGGHAGGGGRGPAAIYCWAPAPRSPRRHRRRNPKTQMHQCPLHLVRFVAMYSEE